MDRWFKVFALMVIAVAMVDAEGVPDLALKWNPSSCVDLSPVCGSWASYCDKLSEGTFQTHWCPKTCNRCKGGSPVLADAAPSVPAGGENAAKETSTTSTQASSSTSEASTSTSTSSSTSTTGTTSSSTSSSSTSTAASSSTSAASTLSSTSSSSAAPSSTSSSTTFAPPLNAPGVNAAAINPVLPVIPLPNPPSPPPPPSIPIPNNPQNSQNSPIQTAPPPDVSVPNIPQPNAPPPNGPPPNVPPPNVPPPNIQSGNSSVPFGAPVPSVPQGFDERPYLCQADYRLLPKLNEDNLKMAIGLYRRAIEDSPKDNILFSPAAIAVAMALMEVGTRTVAQAELHQALSPSLNGEDEAMAFSALLASLRGEGGQSHFYNFRMAQALYVDNNFPVLREYSETATKCFDTVTGNYDFQRKSEPSRLTINEWVRDHTESKVQNLFPPNGIDSDDRMVLLNVVYLFAEWANSFVNGRTYNRLFYPPNNAPGVEVPMMSMEGTFRYYEQPDLQVLGIDYRQRELTLFLILPTNREGLAQFERTLEPKELARLMNAAQDTKVDVTIPKFAVNYRFRLKEAMQAMGVKLMFDISGDLHGISKKHDLFMTSAVHQAYFKVGEAGIESAPARNAPVDPASPDRPSIHFRAENPFLFFVRHSQSNSILFMGRVVNGKIKEEQIFAQSPQTHF